MICVYRCSSVALRLPLLRGVDVEVVGRGIAVGPDGTAYGGHLHEADVGSEGNHVDADGSKDDRSSELDQPVFAVRFAVTHEVGEAAVLELVGDDERPRT